MKVAIVGAGLSGAVAANLLSAKHQVEVFETKNHIGGLCWDEKIGNCLVHKYGAHIFHTDKPEIWDYITKFAKFQDYTQYVRAETYLGETPLPVTEESLFWPLDDSEIIKYIFEPYTFKQWGKPFAEVNKSITSRIKTRRPGSPSFFTDRFQGVPVYSELFGNLLEGSRVHLGCEEDDWRKYKFDLTVYTGRLDKLFGQSSLEFRTVDFRHTETNQRLKTCQINNCTYEVPFTRRVDHGFWPSNKGTSSTVITEEFPRACGPGDLPCYPLGDDINLKLAKYYLSKLSPNLICCGRCARYKYLDMADAVSEAIQAVSSAHTK